MKLQEIYESKIKILSERKTKDGSLYILAPWIMTGRKNRNGRLYSQPLIQREVAKFQDRIKSGSVIGSADHPAGAFTTLDTASHIVTKLTVDKDGQGWMEAKILPTSKGKNVIEIINSGGQLGISARGAGTVSPNGIVANDYKLLGIDIVTNPSEPTATFDKSNIFESVEFSEEENRVKDEDLEKEINALEKESWLSACESGYSGSQEDWEKQYSGSLREMMGLPEKESGKTNVQKLTEEAVNAKIMSFYNEAIQGGFIGSISEFKEKYPTIVEAASEVKITEKKKEIKEKFVSRMPFSEAVSAGFKGTISEFKEQHPDIEITSLSLPPQKKVVVEKELNDEEMVKEAARIFTKISKENPKSSITLEDVIQMLEKENEEKVDKRIRRQAIAIVAHDADGTASPEMLEKMVKMEIKNLQEARKERREKNWEAYKRLLAD